MFSALLSILFGISGPDMTEVKPQRVEEIARKVMDRMDSQLPMTPTLVLTERPEPTPLGAITYASGRCKLVINVTPSAWSQWSRFLNEGNRDHWDQIIEASVAHEIGHCMPEHRKESLQITLSTETLNALAPTGHTSSGNHARILKQELFADAVAILYAQENFQPAVADAVISSMLSARVRFGEADPTHDTSRELAGLIAKRLERSPEESFGQAAGRLLDSERD